MKAIAKPISQSDSTLAKNLKKKLRSVKDLERQIEDIKILALGEPESEPKVSTDNLAPPNEASLADDQITLTANQEQNDSILQRQTLDITVTTPNSSHSDLQASPVRQLTDSAITDQSPSNFRRCCDKLFTPLWNLLAGVSRPTVEPAQDIPACSHNASLNQMSVQAPIEPTGQESPANLDPLHAKKPSSQKQPTESAQPSPAHDIRISQLNPAPLALKLAPLIIRIRASPPLTRFMPTHAKPITLLY